MFNCCLPIRQAIDPDASGRSTGQTTDSKIDFQRLFGRFISIEFTTNSLEHQPIEYVEYRVLKPTYSPAT
jgi:hypothetical protein